ncbi:unnamed protein product [marine sediment metagenome]|uniref:Uncharacterized protein n=1 Tax=marine sediment metagenome TaxID=412755 RepID=X0WP48_9ZZZZ
MLDEPKTQKEVEEACKQGMQWCHICEDWDCGDNINLQKKLL